MERELVITGIGGQGIQLMAKILAQAASSHGRFVMLFGIYMGMMRGGASDSTVVISDEEIAAPPIIPQAWSVLAMHPLGLAGLLPKLRPGGLLFVNTTLVSKPIERGDISIAGLPATRLAEEAGNIMGAGMVALGAFTEVTSIVPFQSLVAAMRETLPPHRQHLAAANEGYLAAGARYAGEHLGGSTAPAWSGAGSATV
jgi:Pyruvate/2-oxoacid:ferredoxin oxidoreductase gamma subunit